MSEIKAVIFDIDGTLTTRISWNFLAEKLGDLHQREMEIFKKYKTGELTQLESDQQILDLWRSTGKGTKRDFAEIFQIMPLRLDAKEVVDYLQSHGKIVCLITGAMDLYAQITAQRLSVENYYANTVLNWDAQGQIINFDYTADQNAKKLEHFAEFCEKFNLKPEECVVVGDGDNDYGLFQLTNKGIAIRSEFEDEGLEKIAWKVIQNLREIKELVK